MFQITPGGTRRRYQWACLALCALMGISLWLRDGALLVPGWSGWLALSLLALAAWLGWRALSWPWANHASLEVVSGRWCLRRAGDDSAGEILSWRSGRLAILPGLLILPWKRGRRLWVFADECSPQAWRRLNLCARFDRQGR